MVVILTHEPIPRQNSKAGGIALRPVLRMDFGPFKLFDAVRFKDS